jgi:hypothetical protein
LRIVIDGALEVKPTPRADSVNVQGSPEINAKELLATAQCLPHDLVVLTAGR